MDADMKELVKNGYKGLHLFVEMSKHAATIGRLGDQYSERYFNKSEYRIPQQCGIEWVEECFGPRRHFYKMFRMSIEMFSSLHDLLVSTYGLKSTSNVSSVESLAMFLYIVGGPQSFSHAENWFSRSTWTVHMKFKEVLLCLGKLAKDNIKLKDPSFTNDDARVREARFWPHFKGAIGAIDVSHIKVSVCSEEVVNHTCWHRYTSHNILAICDFDMRYTFVVAGWPGSAHDTRILNHALTNFGDQFPKPPADANIMHLEEFIQLILYSTYYDDFVFIYREVLSCGFRLSKPNWVSRSLQREYISSTRIPSSTTTCTSREV
jgi:hypothetical protein